MIKRTGATAVEFALMSSVMLLIVFGSIEFFRANLIRHNMIHAAYEASREVVVPGANRSEAIAKANQVLGRLGIKDAEISITPESITEETPFVTTTISVPMKSNSWMPIYFQGAMEVETTLRTERLATSQVQFLPTILNPPPPPPTPPPTDPPTNDPPKNDKPKQDKPKNNKPKKDKPKNKKPKQPKPKKPKPKPPTVRL